MNWMTHYYPISVPSKMKQAFQPYDSDFGIDYLSMK